VTPLHVAVVGGGWAGCAAAAACAQAGHRVTLLEAGAELGGRARRLTLELAGTPHVLDNGQHLLIGAYTAIHALLQAAGVRLDDVVLRRPFEMRYADGVAMAAARLPAPWHLAAALLRARGFSLRDRLAMAGFLPRLRAQQWTVAPDRPAAQWLAEQGQTVQLIDRVWRPLVLAALNTAPDRASAQVLATVLRDSLGGSATAAEMWLPRADLSTLLPEAVERLLKARGGTVLRHRRVDLARATARGWTLAIRASGDHASMDADALVYAAPPGQLQRIFGLHGAALKRELRLIERFDYEPITTIYLKYAADEPRLPPLFHALVEAPARRHYGQWVFNRGALDGANRGIAAVVISSGGMHEEPTLDALAAAAADQLGTVYGLPAPLAARAIVERRATLACVPDLERPAQLTALPRLVLAGDWTASEYPCTLESAVRAGTAAAALLARSAAPPASDAAA